jgi:ubiquinone/menaquinone biosynthesis C-methylase UbiE
VEFPERAIVKFLKEASRLLRPGGTIAVSDQSVSIHGSIIDVFLLSYAAKVKDPSGMFPMPP